MRVTLFNPGQPQVTLSSDGFLLPDATTCYAQVSEKVAAALGCNVGLVDVLDCNPDFVAYTIFDCEGEANAAATLAVKEHSKHPDAYEEDELCGPVLVVTKS